MKTGINANQQTLIEALQTSFSASLKTPEGVAEPAVLLWTDTDGHWQGLLPALSALVPQLFTLGSYNPEKRTGPVIWLKCILDRTLPDVSPPAGVIPILYLPGVSRQELRAGGDCPRNLQPLIELQYRGAVWHQRNGRDWTVEAFLTSENGLALDMAQDARTREAMLRALPKLATHSIEALRGRRLEAEDFDRIIIGDPVSDLLKWMSAPDLFERSGEQSAWQTFRNVCIREFGFDPEKDGPIAAGDALMHGGGAWDSVWSRFCESPRLYPGVAQLLRGQARDLFADPSRRPTVNEEQEVDLQCELEKILTIPHQDACNKVVALNEKHKERREWVWAKLGYSPLATALAPLAVLGKAALSPLGGVTAVAMAAAATMPAPGTTPAPASSAACCWWGGSCPRSGWLLGGREASIRIAWVGGSCWRNTGCVGRQSGGAGSATGAATGAAGPEGVTPACCSCCCWSPLAVLPCVRLPWGDLLVLSRCTSEGSGWELLPPLRRPSDGDGPSPPGLLLQQQQGVFVYSLVGGQ